MLAPMQQRGLGFAIVVMACAVSGVRARAEQVLPIVVHVVESSGRPVADAQFIAERVARANQIYAPYAVRFEVVQQRPLAAKYARMESRADRDALGAEVGRGAIDCFVVESLRDVDDPEQLRRGVHWHSKTYPNAHFVILSVIGGPNVLAHELGHFLGNPQHSQTPGNLMSYRAAQVTPFLDDAQLAKLRRALSGYLRRGELKVLPPSAASAR
jgi:hypothetical protein